MFWVISVYFNIRNTLPKFCPFLLGHPVYSTGRYDARSESKERFAIQRYLLIIRKKQNMQVLSHTFTYFCIWSPWTLRHLSYRDTSLLFPPRIRRPPGTNFAVLQMFGDNFVHNCTRHFRTLFVHFANCEMSILSNDAVHLLLQCVCDDRGSP